MTVTKKDVSESLKKLSMFLERHQVKYWPERVTKIQNELLTCKSEDEASAIVKVRELFQGAGTLDDLGILKVNGHKVDDEEAANNELDKIIASIKKLLR